VWQEINYTEDPIDILVPDITYKINPAEIESIEANSIAEEIGFESGDSIISINGKKPRDLIDYQILISEEILNISVLDKNHEIHNINIEKDQDVNLGINFKDALFDSIKQCNNRCPFCFIDQQPSGKRKSLYIKDDDYRLSFLYGSYLTLTNLKKEDWDRIAMQKLSPLFISVHATDPAIREKLLKNKKARVILDQISWFEKNSIQIHAQIVVCPDINDGYILEKSILELAEFYKKTTQTVLSVAIVPVGLTKFRPENDGLKSISQEYAKNTIKQVERIQASLQITLGTRFCWLADEWYLIAGKNFGSGSSREHAAWAIYDYGFRCVISSFFADIFRNNCLNVGVLPVQISPIFLEKIFQAVHEKPQTNINVNLKKQKVSIVDIELSENFEINEYKKNNMLNGFDDIDYLLEMKDSIIEFSKNSPI